MALKNAVPAQRGTDYQVSCTTQKLADEGDFLDVFALTASGALVGGLSTGTGPSEGDSTAITISNTVGLYTTGRFSAFSEPESTSMHDLDHPIISGSVAYGRAVWSESLAEDPPHHEVSLDEWRIVSADLETGLSVNVATSKGATADYVGDRQIDGDGSPRPTIAGAEAYWHTETITAYTAEESSAVLSAPLDGSTPMALGHTSAEFPSRLTGGLALAERIPATGQPGLPAKITLAIPGQDAKALLNIAEGAEDEHGFSSFNAGGTVLSFTDFNDFYIVDVSGRTAIASKIPTDTRVTGVTHCGPRISWTYQDINDDNPQDARYLYDTASATLRVINDQRLTGTAHCAGDYLAWGVASGQGKTFKTWDVVTRWKK